MDLKAFDESIIMSERKIQRHNVFITRTLDATARFNVDLSCPFTPTEVKVRALTYVDTEPATGPYSLHVERLGEGGGGFGTCLGSFMNPGVSHSGIIEPLSTFSNGTYPFFVLFSGLPTAECDGGVLGIHLEFRRIA